MNKAAKVLAAIAVPLSLLSGPAAQAANTPPPAQCAKAAADLAGLVTDFDHWKAVARRSDQKDVQLMEARITTRKAYLAKAGDMQDVYQCQEMARSILVDSSSVKFKLDDAIALDKCIKVTGKTHFDILSAKYEVAKAAGQIVAEDEPAFSLIGMRLTKSKKDLADENLKILRCETIVQELDEDGKALIAMQKKAALAAKAAAKKK